MKLTRLSFAVSTCAVVFALGAALSAGQGNQLGKPDPGSRGRKARGDIDAPVPGALHGAAAVEALKGELGQRVRERGGSPDDYAGLLAADDSAWIGDDGQLMFIDVAEHEAEPGPGGGDTPPDATEPTGPPPTPLAVLPNGMPIHHSKAGASWTIYLDFDGEIGFRSTSWGLTPRNLTGLTLDADTNTFNADEQAIISRTWGRVAEDWAPFNVDVTTERPAVIGNTVLWSIISKSPAEVRMPRNVGGVSQFNFGYVPFGLDRPTFTFWEPWGATDHSTIADVISQENGHMFGLLHDGNLNPFGFINEYYGGHGTGPTSWGPIMGAPQNRNVTQWSLADYPGGLTVLTGFGKGVFQDDIAIIAGKLGFRSDDFADTMAGAAPLAHPTTGYITGTTDVDVFALPIANDVHIEITPFRAGELTDGGNLDVAADILNAAGTVVATVDDVTQTAASLTVDLPLTQHYLRVRPSFDAANYSAYGSLGAYTVTGTFVRSIKLLEFQEPLSSAVLTPGRALPVKFTLSDSVAAARVLLLPAPLAAPANALAESSCKAQQNSRQHCNLRLPATLTHGDTYWLLTQFQDIDGSWVNAKTVTGGSAQNPSAIVVD